MPRPSHAAQKELLNTKNTKSTKITALLVDLVFLVLNPAYRLRRNRVGRP